MASKGRFRLGVGIIVSNQKQQVLWAKRFNKEAWQFPQGGIRDNETPKEALYRELEEEIGLTAQDVELLGSTKQWLKYRWPEHKRLRHKDPDCLGQKQKWFLLRLISQDTAICLDNTHPPEFERWSWVNYWYPLDHIVAFKQATYQHALRELVLYCDKPGYDSVLLGL